MCFTNIYSFNPHINLRYRSVYKVKIATLLNYLRIIAPPQQIETDWLTYSPEVYTKIYCFTFLSKDGMARLNSFANQTIKFILLGFNLYFWDIIKVK